MQTTAYEPLCPMDLPTHSSWLPPHSLQEESMAEASFPRQGDVNDPGKIAVNF